MDPKRTTGQKPAGQPKSGAKPPAGKAKPAKPGDGFLGWFGRQVGHVSKAVKADVTKPAAKRPAGAAAGGGAAKAAKKPAGPPPKAKPTPAAAAAAASSSAERVLYREDKVEEAVLPDRPGVILRRTIIDEVVVETETTEAKPEAASRKPE